MSTQVVHFTVAGADITRIARDTLLSDEPGKAWRILTTGLHGDGIEKAAIEVLSGRSKLIGDSTSGIRIRAETARTRERFEQKLRWIYAGRIRINGKWMRPTAEVTNYGPSDLWNNHGKPVTRVERGRRSGFIGRGWHYCLPAEILVDETIIFEPCGERPMWWPELSSTKEALAEWASVGRTLSERGWEQIYGDRYEDAAVVTNLYEDEDGEDVPKAVLDAEARRLIEIEDGERERDDERRASFLAKLREEILKQANGDLIELAWDDEKVMVPRAPFLHWCFGRRDKLQHLAPPWTPVSPFGLKMMGDDPYHSDWMVGAGLDLVNYHAHPSYNAAIKLMGDLQIQMAGFTCTVLVEGKEAIGRVVHPKLGEEVEKGTIVVLPNLNPKYLKSTINAAAVITEVGGATAHLSQVGRERSLPMVLVKDARRVFPKGVEVIVNTKEGTVEIL